MLLDKVPVHRGRPLALKCIRGYQLQSVHRAPGSIASNLAGRPRHQHLPAAMKPNYPVPHAAALVDRLRTAIASCHSMLAAGMPLDLAFLLFQHHARMAGTFAERCTINATVRLISE